MRISKRKKIFLSLFVMILISIFAVSPVFAKSATFSSYFQGYNLIEGANCTYQYGHGDIWFGTTAPLTVFVEIFVQDPNYGAVQNNSGTKKVTGIDCEESVNKLGLMPMDHTGVKGTIVYNGYTWKIPSYASDNGYLDADPS